MCKELTGTQRAFLAGKLFAKLFTEHPNATKDIQEKSCKERSVPSWVAFGIQL
jgi:hypothetical protein